MAEGACEPVRKRGVIIGKFMPPHRGHQYLIDFGRCYADDLVVMVCSLSREPIPGELRFQWVRDSFPGVQVIHHDAEIPQEPSEHPDFWSLWQQAIWNHAGKSIDYVFASEDYGCKLAEMLGAEYIPVDHSRSLVPISATKIRTDPFRHWDFILPAARSFFLKRVAIIGPESAGKSTMARQLASHYMTVCVEEYARGLLDFTHGWCEPRHIPLIARGHLASDFALSQQASRLIFCDTDLLTTTVWSNLLFQNCPDWVRQKAEAQSFDLTLLLETDLDWKNDGQRYMPDQAERQEMFRQLQSGLERLNRPYVSITGRGSARLQAAIDIIEKTFFLT